MDGKLVLLYSTSHLPLYKAHETVQVQSSIGAPQAGAIYSMREIFCPCVHASIGVTRSSSSSPVLLCALGARLARNTDVTVETCHCRWAGQHTWCRRFCSRKKNNPRTYHMACSTSSHSMYNHVFSTLASRQFLQHNNHT